MLVEGGWRLFLVKVHNEGPASTAELRGGQPRRGRCTAPRGRGPDRWLDLQMFDRQPLTATLSGLELEYRIVQLYSRDAGKREARFSFNVGQGTQDIGFRGNEVPIAFDCPPSQRRHAARAGRGRASRPWPAFLIRDAQGRVYPSQAKRLAPDFSFHPQIYRADGETVRLPDGAYTVEFRRGPESRTKTQSLTVGRAEHARRRHFPPRALDRPREARLVVAATTTSTPPAARTTSIRPRACPRRT